MTLEPRPIRTTEALIAVQEWLAAEGRQIISRRNRDYGDHNAKKPDPFANLRRHGAVGILVRLDDKIARLTTFAKTGRLVGMDESFLDTAIDGINYLAILVAYVLDEQYHDAMTSPPQSSPHPTTP